MKNKIIHYTIKELQEPKNFCEVRFLKPLNDKKTGKLILLAGSFGSSEIIEAKPGRAIGFVAPKISIGEIIEGLK